jgi:hypothetical protein
MVQRGLAHHGVCRCAGRSHLTAPARGEATWFTGPFRYHHSPPSVVSRGRTLWGVILITGNSQHGDTDALASPWKGLRRGGRDGMAFAQRVERRTRGTQCTTVVLIRKSGSRS